MKKQRSKKLPPVAAAIVERRDQLGIRDAELARRLKTSRSRVHDWTHGTHEPRLHNLRDIARALECDVSDLLETA